VTETLRDANGDTQVLLDVGPDFLGTTADLVADQKRNLDCLLDDLGTVITTLGQDGPIEDVANTLRNGPTGFGYVARSVDNEADGPWIRVNLTLHPDVPDAPTYVPRRNLPVVPSVSPCTSELTAYAGAPFTPTGTDAATGGDGADGVTGAGEEAAGADDRSGDPTRSGTLPATGGEPLVALALFLLAGAAATWRLRRS
jgi:hypothetical protein